MRRVLLCLLTTACAANAEFAVGPPSDATTSPEPTEPTAPEDSGQTTPPPVAPTYWSFQGLIAVTAGLVDPLQSVVEVSTWSDVPEVLCGYEVSLLDASPAVLGDADLVDVAWWSWALDEATGDAGCGDWPSRTFETGLGPLDDRLAPSLDARGWLAADLYGLYLRNSPSEPLLVIGAAGTASQLQGDVNTVVASPIPDGLYELHTLILLDLE